MNSLISLLQDPPPPPPPQKKTMLPETLKLVTILQHQADSAYLIDITHHNLKKWSTRPAIIREMTIS